MNVKIYNQTFGSGAYPMNEVSNKRKNDFLVWLPGICYMAVVFALSAQSSFAELPSVLINLPDKLVHGMLYMGLTLAIYYGASKAPIKSFGSPYFQSFVISIIYGALDEFHQSFVPHRSIDIKDWAADVCGAAIMLLIIYAYNKCRGERNVRRKGI